MNDFERVHLFSTIEAEAVHGICALATAAERDALGLYCEYHGNTLVTACRAEDGILMNRTIGLSPADADRLDEILAVYRSRGIPRAFISVNEEDNGSLGAALAERGLVEARSWAKFVRGDSEARAAKTDLDVHEIDAGSGKAFGDIVANAFGLPDAFASVLARLPGSAGWHVFMSFDGGTPAGAGAMYLRNDVAWLGFGATDPGFRCHGSQGAIMAARVQRARELGARLMNTETGEAVPGDPQHSWKNIERAGFWPLHRIHNHCFTC